MCTKLCCALFCRGYIISPQGIIMIHLPISFRVVSLALGQSCDCLNCVHKSWDKESDNHKWNVFTYDLFTDIFQGCVPGTGAIIWLLEGSEPKTNHSKTQQSMNYMHNYCDQESGNHKWNVFTYDLFTDIFQGCVPGTGAIIWLLEGSEPKTNHSKAQQSMNYMHNYCDQESGNHKWNVFTYDLCTDIFQGWFTGTGAIMWLPQWQWSNPEGYG